MKSLEGGEPWTSRPAPSTTATSTSTSCRPAGARPADPCPHPAEDRRDAGGAARRRLAVLHPATKHARAHTRQPAHPAAQARRSRLPGQREDEERVRTENHGDPDQQELAAQLNAPAAQRYPRAIGSVTEREPVGAYLRSVTVTGFRGIGAAAT